MIAQVATLAGAVVSLGLMFYTGRHQQSIVLILLFTGWVLAPFVALLAASRISWRWSYLTHTTVYTIVMLVITLCSLLAYSGVLSPPGTPSAAVFLIVPFLSWVLVTIAITTMVFLSDRKDHT